VLPGYVSSLEDFWLWLEREIDGSGGWLSDTALRVRPITARLDEPPENWAGLVIERHRLHFHDGTFLDFHLVVDNDLVPVEYGYHYQGSVKSLIWRKDKHPGHDELPGPEHIHQNTADPDEAEDYSEVDLAEVLDEVREHQANRPTRSPRSAS